MDSHSKTGEAITSGSVNIISLQKKRRNLSCIYTLIHPISSMIEPDIFSLNNLLELQNYNNVILINI
jgi:hypothetical protein